MLVFVVLNYIITCVMDFRSFKMSANEHFLTVNRIDYAPKKSESFIMNETFIKSRLCFFLGTRLLDCCVFLP